MREEDHNHIYEYGGGQETLHTESKLTGEERDFRNFDVEGENVVGRKHITPKENKVGVTRQIFYPDRDEEDDEGEND